MIWVAIVPMANRNKANAAMDAAGYGPNNFNAALTTDGEITHYASACRDDLYSGSNLPASVQLFHGVYADVIAAAGLEVA